MDLQTQHDQATAELKAAKKAFEKAQKQFDTIDEQFQAKIGKTICGVNVKTRKASYLITNSKGIAITMPIDSNTYRERHVKYHGGESIDKNSRMGLQKWCKWLAEQ